MAARPFFRWSGLIRTFTHIASIAGSLSVGRLLLQAHLLEGRRPGIRVDEHQRGLGRARAHRARPDVGVDRGEAYALGQLLLDAVEQRLALLAVDLARLLGVEGLDVRPACVGGDGWRRP